jgi:hypothetical protein
VSRPRRVSWQTEGGGAGSAGGAGDSARSGKARKMSGGGSVRLSSRREIDGMRPRGDTGEGWRLVLGGRVVAVHSVLFLTNGMRAQERQNLQRRRGPNEDFLA